MYAVIMAGGKQYKVAPGQVLIIEKLLAEIGSTVDFPVLMLAQEADIKVGVPYVANSKVTAEVLAHGRGDKVRIIKFRRRKHHRKQMGHRQWFTKVRVTEII